MPKEDNSMNVDPFAFLAAAFDRPKVFSEYTADHLWQDEHMSQRMLELHLDEDAELASRPHAFIERAVCEPNLLGGFFSANDYFGFQNTFKYDTDHVSLDKYTIVERDGVRLFYNWLQHYGVDELTAELGENGFAVREVYSNLAGDRYETDSPVLAVVAQMA